MLALNKIINLIGGWTYKSKHDLDKASDIITSSIKNSNSKSKSKTSSNSSSGSKTARIKYHKKARGTRYKKVSKSRSNKTRSKR
jgi:hypothetical protein